MDTQNSEVHLLIIPFVAYSSKNVIQCKEVFIGLKYYILVDYMALFNMD
mgnify:CR=1 FL=1